MIIIKTKNGDILVNDKEVTTVRHDRERHTVTIIRNGGPMFAMKPIDNVEGLLYTNDSQPTSWKDEGSEIKRLLERCDDHRHETEWLLHLNKKLEDAFRSLTNEIRNMAGYYEEEIPRERFKAMRERAEEQLQQVEEGFMYRRKFKEQQKQTEDHTAIEEARLNGQVEELYREKERLKDNQRTYESQIDSQAAIIHDLMHRSLWQRILNRRP